MKFLTHAWLFFALLGSGAFADQPALSRAEQEGRQIARDLITQAPLEDSTATGRLVVRERNRIVLETPVRLEVRAESCHWKTTYQTEPTDKAPATRLTVVHRPDEGNRYELSMHHRSRDPEDPKILSGAQTTLPFAGTDFWLADLGLEFFHWPQQRLLKKELRRGQSCYVLESVNPEPPPGGYARVVSWIDIDTSGIVIAEAFDAKGKILKEFKPKTLERVAGRWEIKELEIRNTQTGSRTLLIFDLE